MIYQYYNRQVNDDDTDNRFLEKAGRFPPVDEDEEPVHLLAVDYRV
ncbi:MAG: D-lyxose/D-mannose family sugar isomerase [Clostridia bacterium]|nr:D-lyxose/D-mannose family sugar isomerase [Clostridia bacterium]